MLITALDIANCATNNNKHVSRAVQNRVTVCIQFINNFSAAYPWRS